MKRLIAITILILPLATAFAGTAADRAYAILNSDGAAAALSEFQAAVAEDPSNLNLREDYGWALLRADRPLEARQVFDELVSLDPMRLSCRLQLVYLLLTEGDRPRARGFLEGLRYVRDEQIASTALAQIGSESSSLLWVEYYAFPRHSRRFDLVSGEAQIRIGHKTGGVEPYLEAMLTGDDRSTGDLIFNENLVSLTFGLRRNLGPGFSVYAQTGRFHRFKTGLGGEVNGWDSRLGFRTYARAVSGPRFAELDLDLAWYQRYANVIGYLQLRAGLDLGWVRPYLAAGGIADTTRDFYNNLGKVGVGLQVYPFGDSGPALSCEISRGTYAGSEGVDPNPYPAAFDETTLGLLFSGRMDF